MRRAAVAPRCTLVFGLLRAPGVPAEEALAALAERFGPLERVSSWIPFTQSRYYEHEMGLDLLRAFASVDGLRDPGELPAWKVAASDLEARWARGGRRRVNLDPGLLDLTHLVLASGKPAGHRLYLGQGIHAELEYVFEGRSFRFLPWTYPDYREPEAIEFFNGVREAHRHRLRASGAHDAA